MFQPRVAIASLSGESDAAWAQAVAEHVGCAILGGIAIDEPTQSAARAMVGRNRSEFLPDASIPFIDEQLAALDGTSLHPAFNVRSTTIRPVERAARVCQSHGAILELNAHCRQAEMCAAGAGESLLREPARLCRQVAAAADTGVTVSVKVRTELDEVDIPTVAQLIEEAGADVIHVDAMDTEPAIADVADATDLFVVANNGVRDRDTALEYFEYGADAVSIGRASDDPAVLRTVRKTAENWFAQEATG